MKYFLLSLKYLTIGCFLGMGILLVDQLFVKYGNPQRIVVMERLLSELYDSQSELLELTGVGSFPAVSFRVFEAEVKLEEPCQVHLSQWPGLTCNDYPHITSVSLSPRRDNLEEQLPNLERIAVDGTFKDETVGQFRVVRWTTDIEKLQRVFDESRTEPAPQPRGTPLSTMDMPQSYSAKVCFQSECLRISSGSKVKVEGLVSQVLSE